MKSNRRLFISCVLLALASVGRAEPAAPMTREEAANLKSVDVQTVVEKFLEFQGKVIRLKFNAREAQVTPDVNRKTLTGAVAIHRAQTTVGSVAREGRIVVMMPDAARSWFLKLPTAASASTYSVVARITQGENSEPVAELLGRELTTDFKGVKLSW